MRVGGKFCSRMEAKDGSVGFNFEGVYAAVVPNSLLEYSFGGRTARIEFAESPGGVNVKVSFDAEEENSEEQRRDGWQAILNNF